MDYRYRFESLFNAIDHDRIASSSMPRPIHMAFASYYFSAGCWWKASFGSISNQASLLSMFREIPKTSMCSHIIMVNCQLMLIWWDASISIWFFDWLSLRNLHGLAQKRVIHVLVKAILRITHTCDWAYLSFVGSQWNLFLSLPFKFV